MSGLGNTCTCNFLQPQLGGPSYKVNHFIHVYTCPYISEVGLLKSERQLSLCLECCLIVQLKQCGFPQISIKCLEFNFHNKTRQRRLCPIMTHIHCANSNKGTTFIFTQHSIKVVQCYCCIATLSHWYKLHSIASVVLWLKVKCKRCLLSLC